MDSQPLHDVNEFLSEFDVTMYSGADGKDRIWGDINRIQDIVDSPRAQFLFPPGALADLHDFFATDVDGLHAVLRAEMGYDIPVEAQIEPDTPLPTEEQSKELIKRTYDWFRVPPEGRPEAPLRPSHWRLPREQLGTTLA